MVGPEARTTPDTAPDTQGGGRANTLEHAFDVGPTPPAKCGGLRPEDMPDWWPADRPPQKLHEGMIYRGVDGKWRDMWGVLVSRKARRAAGVR